MVRKGNKEQFNGVERDADEDAKSLEELIQELETYYKGQMKFDSDATERPPRDLDNTGSNWELSDSDFIILSEDTERVAHVSDRHLLVQHSEICEAVVNGIDSLSIDGDVVSGTVREYARNGMMSLDILFDHRTLQFENPDAETALMVGLEIRNSVDATSAIKARPFVQQSDSGNAIRSVFKLDGSGQSDWLSVRHVSPSGETETKLAGTLQSVEEMVIASFLEIAGRANSVFRLVENASNSRVDFSRLPYTLEEWLEEFLPSATPEKLIEGAAARAMNEDSTSGDSLSWWSVISALAWALENKTAMSDGPNKDRYHRLVSSLLKSPEEQFNEVHQKLATDKDDESDRPVSQLSQEAASFVASVNP